MFESYRGAILSPSLLSGCDNGANYWVGVSSVSTCTLILHDLRTLSPIVGSPETVVLTVAYQYCAFIDNDNVLLTSSTSSTPRIVNVLTGAVTVLNAQFSAYSTGRCQNQIAVDRINGTAMGTSSTAGRIVTFTSGPFASGNIQPTGQGARTFQCVAHKTGSANFFAGTEAGTVLEVQMNGTIVKTITLPTTPNFGTAPAHSVASIAYADDDLYVISATGILFHYDYPTSTLLDVRPIRNPEAPSTGSAYATNVFNRQFIVTQFTKPICGTFSSLRMKDKGVQEIDTMMSMSGISPYACTGVNIANKLFWFVGRNLGNSAQAGAMFYAMDAASFTSRNVPTRGRNPVDVDHRILRIANWGNCNYDLTVDQSVSNGSEDGQVMVQSPIGGAEEIELSLFGTPNVNESFDVRRYTV